MTFNVLYRTKDSLAVVRGVFEAASEPILRSDLQAQGFSVLLVQASAGDSFRAKLAKFNKLRVRMPRFGVSTAELALLCEIFRALYSSGVQMLQIVRMTLDETPNPWLRKKLAIVLEHLQTGSGLADAMSDPRCRRAFPSLMVETIRTGEENGRLDTSLERLSSTFKRLADTRRETISALAYPAFTLVFFVVVCTVIAILIPDALEKFAFSDFGHDEKGMRARAAFIKKLPFAIRTLFMFHDHPVYLALPPCLIVGLILLWRIGMKFRASRFMLTKFTRIIPLIGTLIERFAIVRYLEVLTANHDSGIAIIDSLRLVRNSIDDAIFEESIDRVSDNILQNGYGLAEAMNEEDEQKVYPGLVRQMVRAGEESGRFTEMLRPIIYYYDEQARAVLKRMLDLLTPSMIIILGAIILPIVLGVYQTITIMNDALVSGYGA